MDEYKNEIRMLEQEFEWHKDHVRFQQGVSDAFDRVISTLIENSPGKDSQDALAPYSAMMREVRNEAIDWVHKKSWKYHEAWEIPEYDRLTELMGNSKERIPRLESVSENYAPEIILSFIGDCTLGENYYSSHFTSYYNTYGPDYFFSGVKSILSNDDLTIANCEGVFSSETTRIDK